MSYKEVARPQYENIPEEMKRVNAWVNYKSEWDDIKGKFTKPPCDPYGNMPKGGFKNTVPFEIARHAEEAFDVIKGVGFGFHEKAHTLVGLDFDHVVDPETKEILPAVKELLEELDSYTEYSISGDGLHVFVNADKYKNPNGKSKQTLHNVFGNNTELEVFVNNGYLTVSGNVVPGYSRSVTGKKSTVLTAIIKDLAKTADVLEKKFKSVESSATEFSEQDIFIKHLEQVTDLEVTHVEDGNMLHLNKCPWEDEHSTLGDTAIIRFNKGHMPVFFCFHAHCKERGWVDLCKKYPRLRVGDCIDAFNERFARVIVSGKTLIVGITDEDQTSDIMDNAATVQGFRENTCEENTIIKGKNGGEKIIYHADLWLRSKRSNRYEGITYTAHGEDTGGKFNLWRGFEMEPSEDGDWSMFRDHWLNNVCNGDEKVFNWFFAWAADIFQNPISNPQSSVVLIGKQGAGKSIVGTVLCTLIGKGHSCEVIGPENLMDRFNSHLHRSVLINASEVTFHRDPKNHARLKGEITRDNKPVERKFKPIGYHKNMSRMIITTDRDSAIPADREERRFLVLRLPERPSDAFFEAMLSQLKDGGYARLMYDLMHCDLSQVNVRKAPITEALEEEWLRNMDPFSSFWYDYVEAGVNDSPYDDKGNDVSDTVSAQEDVWHAVVHKDDLYDMYVRYMRGSHFDKRGTLTKTVFLKKAYRGDHGFCVSKFTRNSNEKRLCLGTWDECRTHVLRKWHISGGEL